MSRLIIPPMECTEEGCTAKDKNAFYCIGCQYAHLPWFEAGVDIASQPDQTAYTPTAEEPEPSTEDDPLTEAIQRVAAAIVQVAEAAVNMVVSLIKRIAKAFTQIWERAISAYAAAAHPKWLHYYKHSKKRRVRKKYYHLIRRQFFRELLIESGAI